MITDSMYCYINDLASSSHEDSKISTLRDYMVWGRYGGPRRSEWCQTTKTKYQTVENGPDEALAFRADDIVFYDANKRVLSIRSTNLVRMTYATVRWRFQKNEENNETITYYRDKSNPEWCPCQALWNIKRRARRLQVPAYEPIAKYRDDEDTKIYFITDTDVNSLLQEAAEKALGITDPEILSKWTTHSVRVTAANELHRLGFSDAFIQKRLRWKSDSFLRYLRDTIHVARAHTMRIEKSLIKVTKEEAEEINNIFRAPNSDQILWEHSF